MALYLIFGLVLIALIVLVISLVLPQEEKG